MRRSLDGKPVTIDLELMADTNTNETWKDVEVYPVDQEYTIKILDTLSLKPVTLEEYRNPAKPVVEKEEKKEHFLS